MILSRRDLSEHLDSDSILYPKVSSVIGRIKNRIVTNPINTQYWIYLYIRCLRLSEYYINNSIFTQKVSISSILKTFPAVYYYWKLRSISYKTGFQIPPNCIGKGLQIWHYGYIIINSKVRIGDNLTIYPGVEIGHKIPGGGCPIIGDNCFIGAGAKIFGDIIIGNNVTIAPNAVVTKDVPDNCVVGGIPAGIIKYKQ